MVRNAEDADSHFGEDLTNCGTDQTQQTETVDNDRSCRAK